MIGNESRNISIINIDSCFDWTEEVSTLIDQIEWRRIRGNVARDISSTKWQSRLEELGTIALVSRLRSDRIYENFRSDWNRENDIDPNQAWRERQLRRNRETCPSFSGEERHFRLPKGGRSGIVECFGIYFGTLAEFINTNAYGGFPSIDDFLVERVNKPAILLCPENILEIDPALARIKEAARYPPRLSANPALGFLKLTLLHELGHHFFPVHKNGAGPFLSEALANFFCQSGLSEPEEAWLLYKTWFLQAPEYSAYREFKALYDRWGEFKMVGTAAFFGEVDLRIGAPIEGSLLHEIRLPAALALGYPCAEGLGNELKCRAYTNSRRSLQSRCKYLRQAHDKGFPIDILSDCFGHEDLNDWLLKTNDLPDSFWQVWSSDQGDTWPDDMIEIDENHLETWAASYARSAPNWRGRAIAQKLTESIKAHGADKIPNDAAIAILSRALKSARLINNPEHKEALVLIDLLKCRLKEWLNPYDEPPEKIPIFDESGELNTAFLQELPIQVLGDFSIRTQNCLRNGRILRIKDLISLSRSDLLKTPNLGRKSLSEIRERLLEFNLELKFGQNEDPNETDGF